MKIARTVLKGEGRSDVLLLPGDEAMVQLLDQKWIADIEARGALRAKRAWLKEDIAKRFGALPAQVATRIDSIENEDHLDAAKSRLDTATSLDQLFR